MPKRLSVRADDRKLTNPKDALGSKKVPLSMFPSTAIAYGCMGLRDGAGKYGRSNYRAIGVRASIYMDAILRHIFSWYEGADVDETSKLHPLCHVLADVAILVDAIEAGVLRDDRMFPGGYRKAMKRLEPHVARLDAAHAAAGRAPHHYTIRDMLGLRCAAHPKYEAKRKPRADCAACLAIWKRRASLR